MNNNSNPNRGHVAPETTQAPPVQPNYSGYAYPPYSYNYNPYAYYYGYNMTQPFYYPQTSYPPIVFTSKANQSSRPPYVPPTRQPLTTPQNPQHNLQATATASNSADNFPKKDGVTISFKKPLKALEQRLKIFSDEISHTSASKSEHEKKKDIPDSLRSYVIRCFQACRTDFQKKKLEVILKPFLTETMKNGTAFTIDWENKALISVKRNKKSIKKKKSTNAFKIQPINVDLSVDINKKNERQPWFEINPPAMFMDVELPTAQSQIVGSSTSLEKPYLRLTGESDPKTVRPLHILINSFEHVINNWKNTKNYSYASEQLKSIRQDLTVQGILYEEHARIALEMKDRDEFNQCQTCLKQMYKEGIKGNESEFIMYNILYLTYTKNHIEMASLLSTLDPSIEKQPAISLAIKLYIAYKDFNFLKFFTIYQKISHIPGACSLIQLFVDQYRMDSFKIIVSSFPKISKIYVSKLLGFDGIDQFQLWMDQHKIDYEGDILDCRYIRSNI